MISSFTGEYEFLSNFYRVDIPFEGRVYPSSEHAYQAAKLPEAYKDAFAASSMAPGRAKRLVKTLPRIPEAKDERWRIAVMTNILAVKFQGDLAAALIATGDAEIVEGNYWGDVFWGVCDGRGRNELGKILMSLRKQLTSPGLFVI